MLCHVACFRWVEGTTDEQVARLRDMLAALPAVIGELRRYRFGPDAGLGEGNFDFVVVAEFADTDGWRAYQEHPDHVRVLDYLRPMVAERARAQFVVDG
ncbi:MAG TPA: Dabb family protein [Acidimicrobiia bacterium]